MIPFHLHDTQSASGCPCFGSPMFAKHRWRCIRSYSTTAARRGLRAPWCKSGQVGSNADCRRYWPPTSPAIRGLWGSTRSAPPASCANTVPSSDALVAKHGGRIVKTTGDGVLIEFPSVVDAVECAVAVQAMMAERNDGVPADRRMLFRIGINLGDILIEGDDILGDGVNIAARLEGIAEPGGICISSSAYDQVLGKVAVEFADLGEQNLKNITRPVRAYAVVPDGTGPGTQGGATPSPLSAPRLSIVVLPFANIGGDPEQEYFVDGVTESLTTDLSRISRRVRDCSQHRIYVQGQSSWFEADRPRTERPLCARRFGAARRQPPARERAVDRRGNRQSPLGRAFRQARG